MNKFKVNDMVVANVNSNVKYCKTNLHNNWKGVVTATNSDGIFDAVDCMLGGQKYEYLDESCFDLYIASNKEVNEEPKDKWMIYGDGCNNWSGVIDADEDSIKDKMKEYDSDKSWRGNITAYKLEPVFKLKQRFLFTRLKKVVKITKKVSNKKNKRRK